MSLGFGGEGLRFQGQSGAGGGGGASSGWQDDGTVVRLVTTADGVAVGALVMSGNGEKLRVVGIARVEGNLQINDPGVLAFVGVDSAAAFQNWVRIIPSINDPTAGSEDSQADVYVQVAGVETQGLSVVGIQVQAPAGTAAAPGFAFIPNSNIGIRPSAGTLALVAGGGERVRVSATALLNDVATQWTGDITPAALGVGPTNDYAPAGLATATVIRQDMSAAGTLNGLTGGADGRVVVIHNISAVNTLTLAHEAAGSVAANRFFLPGGASVVVAANSSIGLIYDSTSSRWRVLSVV